MIQLLKLLIITSLLFLSTTAKAQLFQEDFGTSFNSISTVKWPTTCRSGSPSNYNTSIGSCAGTSDRAYSMNGFNWYITSQSISIPAGSHSLTFDYNFDYNLSFPTVEIRTGGACGTTLALATTLANTGAACNTVSIDLSAFSGQTIFIRFKSNTSSKSFYFDNVLVDGTATGGTGDFKWADNFNDNNLILNYPGNDGDEACTGCGNWSLSAGASLELVPSGGWNGNSNTTEAFPDNMSNVYYAKLDRDEYIESPTIDMSNQESLKISFYAKSSSSGTGGGDSWSNFSDHLRLQIWDGSNWITVKDITQGTSVQENKISPALPFNYFCFTGYKSATSPGNYYYTNSPNVNAAFFHSDFKFRVIFEGGFSGAPFAWVDDFTFRADADGYSTMVPCGLSFWNEPAATAYGQDPGATAINNSERGVELELDNAISFPPNWTTEANDGDVVDQTFGSGESERIVFCVISEQEIDFSFPRVSFSSPSIGNRSSTMSKDNNYTGPGWKYYAVEYVSCDLASSSISEPTDDFNYHYVFEYGNEFIPVFYHLNKSGIETGGGATSSLERFDKPDITSTDDCGAALPIELVKFTASQVQRAVLVEWETVTEFNNDYFVVLRSVDGNNFIKIAEVKGAGNSISPIAYSFIDTQPILNDAYYRLKQVDFDGQSTLSEIKAVRFKTDEAKLFPNPSSGLINITNSSSNKIDVYTFTGHFIKSYYLKDNTVDLTNLSKGVYFVHINEGNSIQIEKLIIK